MRVRVRSGEPLQLSCCLAVPVPQAPTGSPSPQRRSRSARPTARSDPSRYLLTFSVPQAGSVPSANPRAGGRPTRQHACQNCMHQAVSDTSTREVKAGRSCVQGQPWLHREVEANWAYMKPVSKTNCILQVKTKGASRPPQPSSLGLSSFSYTASRHRHLWTLLPPGLRNCHLACPGYSS